MTGAVEDEKYVEYLKRTTAELRRSMAEILFTSLTGKTPPKAR